MNPRLLITLSALTLAAGLLVAGPLTPPAGPVASTYKTLAEVEPRTAINAANTPGDADSLFKITQPGSYYLAGNITGEPGKHGIEIAIPNNTSITIDLCGFELVGQGGTLSGISNPDNRDFRATIRNGTVRNWGERGVYLFGNPDGCIAQDLRAANNSADGLVLGGHAVVSRCVAYGNGGYGISCGSACTISDCVASANGQVGILVNSGSVVSSCTAYMNQTDGIIAGNGTSLSRCVASNNAANGIRLGGSCLITGNTCAVNAAAGIFGDIGRNTIQDNLVTDNARGIDMNQGNNFVARNVARGNTIADYELAGTNTVGPIITATGTIATTSPWANFSN